VRHLVRNIQYDEQQNFGYTLSSVGSISCNV